MSAHRRRFVHIALLTAACAVWVVACGSTGSPAGRSLQAPDQADAERSIEDVVGHVRAELEAEDYELPAPSLASGIEVELDARLDADDPVHLAVKAEYAAREHRPIVLRDGVWDDHADTVVAALDNADVHALSGDYPAAEEFGQTRGVLASMGERLEGLRTFRASDEAWAKLVDALEDEDFDPTAAGAPDALLDRLLSTTGAENPLPGLGARLHTLDFVTEKWIEQAAAADVALTLAIAEYAHEMRLAYDENEPRLIPVLDLQGATLDVRMRARIRAFLGHLVRHGATRAIATLEPPHPGYRALVQARRRYVEIAKQGGWGEVSLRRYNRIRKGRTHDGISAVKQRLAVEGYDPGPIDDVVNDELVDAVVEYQEAHQLRADGDIDRRLLSNMNLPVEDRLAKIDVTLQRYRESIVGTFEYYVLVNLPDFHAEVWRDGERRMRFGIVVGKNNVKREPGTREVVTDRRGRPIYPNRTPLLTAFMDYLVFNPYWNVPPRIFKEEYQDKIALNPFWPEQNGFELMNPENPNAMWLRQLPGDDNALGRVKFIFPNEHDVYLHDTPHKRLFRRPVRDFSHGCMRVSEPLKFAEFLLREDGRWNGALINRLLTEEPPERKVINLRRDIPVHIAYFNTRVNDEGHVAFLSDIYRYDRNRIERRTRELEARFDNADGSETHTEASAKP